MKILVTGAGGRLGSRLIETLTERGHRAIGAHRAVFDVLDHAAARAFVMQAAPQWVIHAAAWTDVDGCAREPDKAIAINGLGAQNVALAAAAVGAGFAYVSSNEVFDGRATAPYREYDPTHPVNPYGYSKWVGEQSVQHVNPRHVIIRTAWLFAHGGKNFVQSILNAARAGKPLRVVIDEIANPTYTDDLADGIARLIETDRYGVYHLVNEGACSRYEFARTILDRTGFAATPITPIAAREWPRASLPPTYTPLANLAARSVGIVMRDWRSALNDFLAREGLLVIPEQSPS